jgi:hypothetical protein
MLASISLAKAVEGICRWEKEAENWYREWPKTDGKVLWYVAWKKDLKRHHEEVYPSLKVDSRKMVLMERCLPENIKEKIP